MKGQTVFVLGTSALGCGIAFVENPYMLECEFAFPAEIEQKFRAWYRAGKIRPNSDYLRAWFDAWRMSAWGDGFDDWCRMIMEG